MFNFLFLLLVHMVFSFSNNQHVGSMSSWKYLETGQNENLVEQFVDYLPIIEAYMDEHVVDRIDIHCLEPIAYRSQVVNGMLYIVEYTQSRCGLGKPTLLAKIYHSINKRPELIYLQI